MRVLVANIAAVCQNDKGGAFVRKALTPMMRRNLALGAPAGCEFVLRWCEEGHTHPAFADCEYLPRFADEAIVPIVSTAEEDNFDGVLIACFGDPFLNEARARAVVPVVGLGQSALLMAATMGSRIGIVSPAEILIEPIRELAESYGLGGAVAGIVATPSTAEEQEGALFNAEAAIHTFLTLSRQLIAQGADVLVPACGLLSPALRFAPGLEQAYPNGITEVDGVPVVDLYAAAAAMLSGAVNIRQGGSAWRPRAVPEVLEPSGNLSLTLWDS